MAQIIKRAKGKSAARGRRHLRVRKKITGTAARPRLVVTRSSRHVFNLAGILMTRQALAFIGIEQRAAGLAVGRITGDHVHR